METYSVEAYLRATGVDQFGKAFDNASKSVDSVNDSSKKASVSIGSMVKAIAGVAAAVGVFRTLRNAVDGAITRYDTLNTFPLVLEQMGFSASDSEKAINKLSDGIQGLPTTLDDVAGTAQRLATMTGNLDNATDTTLALNNAFILSGSSVSDVQRGLQQYTQMLSKGEVDLQSWRTLQETMGVALNDVAEAFGYAGESAQNDLYDALKEGHVTFDEFNSKLIELSEETGGFADRALTASGGIRTAFANMNTSIVRGVTNIITAIDDALSKTRLKSIQNIIETIGASSFRTLDMIANAIGPTVSAFLALYNAIEPLFPLIIGLAVGFGAFQALTYAAGAMSLSKAFLALKSALETVAIASMLTWDAMKAHPIITIISILAGLAAMTVYLWKTNEKFRDIVLSVWESIQSAAVVTAAAFKTATESISVFLESMSIGAVNGFNTAMDWTEDAVKRASKQLGIIGGHVSDFVGTLKTGAINAFNTAIEWLSNTTRTVIDFLTDLKESIDIKGVIASVIGPLTTIATLFLGLASPIGWAIKGFALLATQTSIFQDMLSMFAGDMSFGQFVNNVATEIANLITVMAESAAEMITKGAEMITGFIEGMAQKLPEIIQIGTDAITNFVEGLSTSIATIAPIAIGVVTTFIEKIAETIPLIAETGVGIIVTLIESIVTALPLVLGVAVQIITTLIQTVATMIPLLIETGVMILITIIEAIVTNLPLLIETYMQIVLSLVDTILMMIPIIIETVIQLVMTIIDTILTMLPLLMETYIMLMQTLIETIITMLPLIIDTILMLIMTIIETLVENLPLIIDAGIQILTALINGIISILPALIESIILVIESILSVVIENLPLIIDAGIKILMALIEGIIDVLPSLIDAGVQLILALVGIIIQLLPELINAGVQILLSLIKGIIDVLPDLLEAGVMLITELVAAIINMIPDLFDAGIELIGALIEGLLDMLGELGNAAIEIGEGVVSGIGNFATNLFGVGADLMSGLRDGIESMKDTVVGKAKEIGEGVVGWFKRTFDINSPSRVFRNEIGAMLGAGMVLGMEDEISAVQKMAQRLSEAAVPDMPQMNNMDIAGQINGIHARSQRQMSYDFTNEVNVNKQPIIVEIYDNKEAVRAYVNENNAVDAMIRRF